MNKFLQKLVNEMVRNGELGGYVHDTAMSQYIPPTLFHFAPATMSMAAGQVTDTIAEHRAANNETTLVSIPIWIPSNSAYAKGAYLKSIEVDYEVLTAQPTSIGAVVNLITRGADTAVATVAVQAQTGVPNSSGRITVDQHKLVCTITTPFWLLNTQYVILQLTFTCGVTGTVEDFLGAVANFTQRM